MIDEKLGALPTAPGVYLFYDNEGKVIYVGKAKSLRPRVRSYFRDGADDGRALFQLIVKHTVDLQYFIVRTEHEALVLEAEQIKAHKPRYNIHLKDDKKYPWVRITREPYPRIYRTRTVVDDGSEYLGPFSNVRALDRLLETMHRLFPVRSCKSPMPNTTCLEYHIKRCEGPCKALVDEMHYARTIRDARRLLRGQCADIIHDMRNEMASAAEALDYERAGRCRDTIASIELMRTRQSVVTEDATDRDVLGIARDDTVACIYVAQIREGVLLDKKDYIISNTLQASDEEIITAFIPQFYAENSFRPKAIHSPVELSDSDEISRALGAAWGHRVLILVPQRGTKADGISIANRNAKAVLDERRMRRELSSNRTPAGLEALQRDLHLKSLPVTIEAIDISGFQGTDKVGSVVTLLNGKPQRSRYRSFTIKTVEGSDDFASIHEVVTRRFSGLQEREEPFPDLLLIDGGKGQLSSAVRALNELGVEDVPVIGLAKRLEEVFVPGQSEPILLPKASIALRLLQTIRDEAHRFAVKHHRTRRSSRTLSTSLTDIPGVGANRARTLLRAFGSIKRIANASTEQLAALDGISKALAETVLEHLQKEGKY